MNKKLCLIPLICLTLAACDSFADVGDTKICGNNFMVTLESCSITNSAKIKDEKNGPALTKTVGTGYHLINVDIKIKSDSSLTKYKLRRYDFVLTKHPRFRREFGYIGMILDFGDKYPEKDYTWKGTKMSGNDEVELNLVFLTKENYDYNNRKIYLGIQLNGIINIDYFLLS